MRSMTGFGRGEASNGTVTVVVELKTVNNRFRDVQIRLPREYNVLEQRIAGLLKDHVHRGRIEVAVRRSSLEGQTRVVADLALVDQLRAAARAIAERLSQPPVDLPVASVMAMPGVLVTAEAEPDALAEWVLVEVAVEAAAGELAAMRTVEGEALAADLGRHLAETERLRAEIAAASEGLVERLRARLSERVNRLLSDRVDSARLAQEAALLADKADVAEELARLHSHVEQFQAALVADEPVGRRLDFLLQEMNREVNTIGSKAAEHPVSARVVELKTVLERLREQAANVE